MASSTRSQRTAPASQGTTRTPTPLLVTPCAGECSIDPHPGGYGGASHAVRELPGMYERRPAAGPDPARGRWGSQPARAPHHPTGRRPRRLAPARAPPPPRGPGSSHGSCATLRYPGLLELGVDPAVAQRPPPDLRNSKHPSRVSTSSSDENRERPLATPWVSDPSRNPPFRPLAPSPQRPAFQNHHRTVTDHGSRRAAPPTDRCTHRPRRRDRSPPSARGAAAALGARASPARMIAASRRRRPPGPRPTASPPATPGSLRGPAIRRRHRVRRHRVRQHRVRRRRPHDLVVIGERQARAHRLPREVLPVPALQ